MNQLAKCIAWSLKIFLQNILLEIEIALTLHRQRHVSSIGLYLPLSNIPSHTAEEYASCAWWYLFRDCGCFHPSAVVCHVAIVGILEHLFDGEPLLSKNTLSNTSYIKSLSPCASGIFFQ